MRTIESPGVQINEIDLTFNTELPVGTTVFAVGFAPQGPTDELVNVTSVSELENIYGLPTNAAERYFYNTCKQILGANATLLVSRVPYGSGSGVGYTTNYSALVFPVYPYSTDVTDYTLLSGGTGVGVDALVTFTAGATGTAIQSGSYNYYAAASGLTSFVGNVELASIPFTVTGQEGPGGAIADVNFAYVSSTGTLSADQAGWTGTLTLVESDLDALTYSWSISTSMAANLSAGSINTQYQYASAAGVADFVDISDANHYYFGAPYHMTVDENTYLQWTQGGINWKDIIPSGVTTATITGNVGYAGMVVVNELKTTINEEFAGYYVAIADNSKMDKGSNFDSIVDVKTLNNNTGADEWLTLNTDRLDFALTGTLTQDQGSISEIVEGVPSFDFGATGAGGYEDSLIFTVFRVRPSTYSKEARVLDNILLESYIGSLDSTRTVQNPRGGSPLNFFLEDIVNSGSNTVQMFINPNISTRGGAWWDAITGENLKKVRVMADERTNTQSTVPTDPAQPYGAAKVMFDLNSADEYMANGDNLWGIGEFVSCYVQGQKLIGNLPQKLERALTLAENRELIRIDIVPEGGLGTIWTGMYLDMDNWPAGTTSPYDADQINQEFDDTKFVNGILNAHTFDADSEGLYDQATGSASEAGDQYEVIYNVFNNYCETTRKDCVYIADPLRYIFVQGNGEVKVMDDPNKNFSQHMFWPLKNLYGGANSSYACTYANWFKANDKKSSKLVWMPPSGFIANIMVKVDTNQYPWYAPAGLNRGILTDVVDIGINPTQRQRDLLYKNGINPTVYWPGDGYVIWGQKTLLSRPSAFDRINVRRLFLWLEKATLALTRYFVFEQNTVFTRERLKTAITPIFEFAKNNEGVYDYLIVCDERNNTPEVIDRNELVVDIYIKPVRVAEFILVNFIATRTGQDFNELI